MSHPDIGPLKGRQRGNVLGKGLLTQRSDGYICVRFAADK